MGDIRKWFMKSHDKGDGSAPKPVQPAENNLKNPPLAESQSEPVNGGQERSSRRKTSKYFATDKTKTKETIEIEEPSVKRKIKKDSGESPKTPPSKKLHKVEDDDDDFVPGTKKNSVDVTISKKLKSGSSRGVTQKLVDNDGSDEDDVKDSESSLKTGGRGRGGRGATGTAAGGRGRGGGRGGFMNFGDRQSPPHKGEKEVPEGASDCLAGLTFVISGTLDCLEREEAEDLIKRHGGRVTGSVSKKTNYLLCDEDIGGRKSEKAKELGTAFLTEDGLFDMIRASKSGKSTVQEESKKSVEKSVTSLPKKSPQKVEVKSNSLATNVAREGLNSDTSLAKQKELKTQCSSLPWTEKYRPKVPNEMIGNQSMVNQLHNWLSNWNEQFLNTGNKGKGKKQNDSGSKKAVLLSGTPGIGKTTSARLVSRMLSFQAIEVNASDSRGKADAKISKGIGGSNANSIKELVSNEALNTNMDSRSKHPKTVLIMDEVDGMSAGDRGGVADLIASIKISKIPIICICNDRYSQKLKSLVNCCLALSFRKPTKQQMAKRLMQVAKGEGLQVNEVIALEELAERVNGDMRIALNQLQYMSLSMSVIKYDDIRQRLLSSRKDEDISPFVAVDKLLGFNGGKLKMDERIDLSMSDPDLIPLLIQENYINYRPSAVGKDDSGVKRMNLIARAAESIADGDIVNVQIRRYRQWQLSQTGSLASCIFPAALLHGQREILEQGERNFNRFGGWLGKNSTMGKNLRLLEDFHIHFLASRESNVERVTLRLEYLSLLLKRMTDPLRVLSKDEAVKEVLELMNEYSISQEDFDAIVELSKFHGHKNPLDGILPAVKSALTKSYNDGRRSRLVKAADLITLPGMRKAPKKRIAAILEPSVDEFGQEKVEALGESEEESSSDREDSDIANGEKLQSEFRSLRSKGIQVEVELKGTDSKPKKTSAGRGKGGAGSTQKTPSCRGKGGSESSEKKGRRSSGAGAKRKRR
ncbi:replication factor C subunit 1 isoform X3 [Tripterygium wilfordii]|uniref:replication factor C subunit 1 isoform X3 n=1 Tax=Tripterygium wilfordii TaxID=458696 RepID=UPI0018F7FE3B|nr:replication factor C subunit 1 isoform X3 [Tripterygium wilfordii]